jgi:hypothetical protein
VDVVDVVDGRSWCHRLMADSLLTTGVLNIDICIEKMGITIFTGMTSKKVQK